MARLRSFVLACAALTACQPAENAVLIDVHTQAGVSQLRVIVLSLDGPDTWTEPYETINLTADAINADPLHVVVELGGPQRVLVQIEALGMDGSTRLVATRCYTVEGVVRDEVMLVVVGGDVDMDGFVVDPQTVCREPVEGGGETTCDAAIDHVCPDDRAADCNDDDAAFHPGAGIVCLDGMDQDCDGDIEEECADLDDDGHDSCPMSPMGPCDCNDSVPTINPDATDTCNDGIDQDCSADGDPSGDACCDDDSDDWCVCTTGTLGSPCLGVDCDDDNAQAHPGVAEICDGADNDCNGIADELDECRGPDLDGDGVADCGREDPGDPCDCNDCDAAIHPGARELCNPRGIDEDCDTMVDDGCPATDNDGDGYGPNDCRDDDPFAFPHQMNEVQVDRCGDGMASTCIPGDPDTSCSDDSDGDGFTEPAGCEGNPDIRPDAIETCNGRDDDCDGVTDEVLDPMNLTGCGISVAIDFTMSFTDCGSCRSACSIERANACELSTCVCTTDAARAECAAGRNCCSDGCVDLQTDVRHCGTCGLQCDAGENCTGGACMCGSGPACADGELCCDGACIDPNTDRNNCGGCNIVCGTMNTACNVGNCACVDAGGANWEDCDGNLSMNGNGCESDINTNASHCGGCNRACSGDHATSVTCSAGNCGVVCEGGWGDCDGNTRGNACENSLDMVGNCGGCGMVCTQMNATPTCAGDTCAVGSCNAGFGDCAPGGGCETRLNTNTNCGGCGVACTVTGGTPDCSSGTCRAVCSAGLGDCDADARTCETPLNTVANCGACRMTCSITNATEECSTRTCRVDMCDSLWADCNGDDTSCETPLNTLANCGGCGTSCNISNATEECSTGSCRVLACAGGWGDCDGDDLSCETQTNTLMNCGACGMPCNISNATESCSSGACRVTMCDAGWGDCNGDMTSCEQRLNTLTHCGGCNMACGDPNGTEDCSSGSCVITCNSGYDDCGSDNDCDPLNTRTNCGMCGNLCSATQSCCGSTPACIDTASDESNCGGCGVMCGNNETCVSGRCECGTVVGTMGGGPACRGGTPVCCDPPGGGSALLCVVNVGAC